ncbi:MAG: oxaloacetate decarboxylase [Halobacteriales archaeon]
MTRDPGARLRRDVESDGITVLPGVYDALTARLVEQSGFQAAFTSGYSVAASQLGLPDVGYLDLSANLARVRDVFSAVDVPVVADADTGYGNAMNARYTVERFVEAGAGGLILEDQVWPKRCGHMDEKQVVSTEEHATRIRAAADARDDSDEDVVVIARTDAREPLGLDEAIERGRAYEEAGADVVFVEAPETRDELERVAGAFDVPSFANMIEGGKTPYMDVDEVERLGFDVVVYPLAGLFAAVHGAREAYRSLASEGHAGDVDRVDFDGFDELIEAGRHRDVADRYTSG